ncbi:MAG: putative metal-binding motif-containing protein [Chitinophagales bacterium]|nr:putative metal-binding motif-containing protein [Chitinophagales bacterium]
MPSVFADHLFTIMGRFTVLLLFMLYSISSIGQQSYSSGTYTQDFNGLPNSGTFSFIGLGNGPFNFTAAPLNVATMNGWQLLKFTGSGSNAVFLVGTGSGNGGGAYSFGSTGSTDRAVGSLASGTVTSAFGILLTNNSGTAIGSFTITYRGEQWRNGGSNTQNKLAFSYKIGGNISGTGFTAEPLLDFVSLKTSSTAATLDGNASGNFTTISATVSNIVWPDGATLVLKWADNDETGADDGLAIDDFNFTGFPAPPTISTVTTSFTNNFGNVFVGSSSSSSTFSVSGANLTDSIIITPPAGFEMRTGANPFSTSHIALAHTGGTVASTNIDVRFTPSSAIGYNGNISCTSTGAQSQFIPVSGTGLASDFPTKLVITSVNGGIDAEATYPFSVVVQAQDNLNVPQNVTANTVVQLTLGSGGGTLSGSLTDSILAGTNSVTFTNVIYDQEESSIVINAARTKGDTLIAGNSAPFNVLAKASFLRFVGVPASGVTNTNLSTFTVEARRADNTVDNLFTDTITISLYSGTGTLTGTLKRKAVGGVATYNDLQIDQPGYFALQAVAPGVSLDVSINVYISIPAVFTELVVPQYFGSKSAGSTNDTRTPFAVCFRIDNLVPNTSYDLRIGLGVTNGATPDAVTSYGAGNLWNQSAFNANNLLNYFTTDGSGSSGPVWVYIEPTGNASRFDAGQTHTIRVGYAINGSGSFPPSAPNFVGSKIMTALDIATTARTVSTADDGAFLKGSANACISGKYILLYDNMAGSGDPLFSYMARTAIPTQTTQSQLPAAINDIYLQSGTSAIGDFPAVIPIGVNNANGVRRIEARYADNTLASFATNATGNWNTGGNTTTITRRSVATIQNSSAPLNTVTVEVTGTGPSCNGGSGGTDGFAIATATSTANPVSYSWNSIPLQTTDTATGLAAGNYTVIVTDNNTCTASASIQLNNSTPATSFFDTTCDSYSLPWGGTATVTGDYVHTYINTAGCDSIVTAHLTIKQSSTPSAFPAVACDSYTLPWGGTVNSNGAYDHTYTNAAGCDSIITINVTINHASTPTSFSATGCDSYTLPWGGTVNMSGSYDHTYTNAAGCDSMVTAMVTIDISSTYYADGDGDGYGAGAPVQACIQPPNTSTLNTDCNDTLSSVNPGATEICANGIDDNCDNQVDEGCPAALAFDVKCFIQGYMDEFNPGLMKSVLVNQGVGADPNEVDTVMVILHDEFTYADLDTFRGLLHTDGMINCTFSHAGISNAYFVSVKSKNTLETWSAAAVPMSQGSYDFSTDFTQAYPDVNNPNPQMTLVAGVWTIYSGDVNQDGQVAGDDFNIVESDVTGQAFGYNVTDITGEGPTDGADFNLLESNVSFGLFVAHP